MAAGVLPGAQRFPERSIEAHLSALPAKDLRVTVYDQTGEQGSTELAHWLRENGWTNARRLRGGYAEWIEHGEETVIPKTSHRSKRKIGDPIKKGDHAGTVIDVKKDGSVWIWSDDQALVVLK